MWSSELLFADNFEEFLKSQNFKMREKGKGSIVLREYNPGYGRVDLVLVKYDSNKLQARLKQKLFSDEYSQFNKYMAYAMAYLSRIRWVSVKKLCQIIGISLAQTIKLIAKLKSRGLVDTKDNLVKACEKRMNWVIDSIQTFELKLKDWRRGLEQAGRHLWFASESYVVMPKNSEKLSIKLSDNCSAWNVGVILCESQERWETVAKAPISSIPTSHIGWILNESIVYGKIYA